MQLLFGLIPIHFIFDLFGHSTFKHSNLESWPFINAIFIINYYYSLAIYEVLNMASSIMNTKTFISGKKTFTVGTYTYIASKR